MIGISIKTPVKRFPKNKNIVREFVRLTDLYANYVYVGHCFTCEIGVLLGSSMSPDNYVQLGNSFIVTIDPET